VAKGIFTITLFFYTAPLNGHRCEEPRAGLGKYQGMAFTFLPRSSFMVPENNDTSFRAHRRAYFVVLDGLDHHTGKDGDMRVLGSIFGSGDDVESLEFPEPTILFGVGGEPGGAVLGVEFHGLTEAVGNSLEGRSSHVASAGRNGPANLDAAFQDSIFPGGGEIG
jgi:hypothetical protein